MQEVRKLPQKDAIEDVRSAFWDWANAYCGTEHIAHIVCHIDLGLKACAMNPGIRSLELGLAIDVERLRAAIAASRAYCDSGTGH